MRAYRACVAGLLSLAFCLGGCGGGPFEMPVALPASITITAAESADIDAPVEFGSDVGDIDGLTYLWDFGDGTSSADAAPSHQFTRLGEFEVALTVSNQLGDSRRSTFKVTVGHFAMVRDRLCSEGDLRGWCWQRPLPTGNRTKDMAFVDASTGWVVGEGGEILRTQDGGGNWSRQASHALSDLTHIRFVNASTGWIAGEDGVVFRTTDAGANWVRMADSGVAPSGEIGLVALDDQRAVVITSSGFPRATFDGGATWADAGLVPMQVTEDGTLWNFDAGAVRKATRLGLDAPMVSYSADQHWVSQFSMGTGEDGLLLLHDYWTPSFQQLRRTTDGGASWATVATTGLPSGVSYLRFFGASDAWAVASGALYRSADAGSTWSSVTLPAGAEPSDLSHILVAKDAKTLWFSHDHAYFLTTDGGASWAWLRVEEEESLGDLGVNAGGAWQWYGSTIYQTVDVGQHWRHVLGPVSGELSLLTSVWFFDSQRGIAIAFGGRLLETRNGGRDWTPRAPVDDSHVLTINGQLHFASDSLGWMSSVAGVYKTTDGGATWRLPVTDAPMFNVTDYSFVDARNGWAVTDEEYVVHTSDGGESWTLQTSEFFGLNAIAFADARTGIVAGIHGMMRRTTDGGATWHEVDSGVTDHIQRVKFTAATTGWAVGTSGVVLRTTDAGATWSRVSVPTEKHLMGIAFADVDHGWIFGGAGTVLATRDGGKTWTGQASGAAGGALVGGFFLDANTGWMFGQDGLLATATGGR